MLIRIMLHTDNFCQFIQCINLFVRSRTVSFARERPGAVHGARNAADLRNHADPP